MRKYPLVALLAIELLLFSSLFVSGSPPHQNINDALEDPEVLYSYFLEELSRASVVIGCLADEDFAGAEVEQLLFSRHLSIPKQIALEIGTKALSGQLLPTYYGPFQGTYDELDAIGNLQSELSSLLLELWALEDRSGIGAELLIANVLLADVNSNLDGLKGYLEDLVPLGYEISGVMVAIGSLEETLNRYASMISELENQTSYEGNMLYLMVSRSEAQGYYGVKVSGFFYYGGLPVADNAIALHFNEQELNISTDHDGRIHYDHILPADIWFNQLDVFAETGYSGEAFVSNTVTLHIEIGSMLSLSRSYDITGNVASIFLSGQLRDVYGNGLSARDITISVNGGTIELETDNYGRYSYSFQDNIYEKGTYTVFSDYVPGDSEPYLSSRSQTLVFTIFTEQKIPENGPIHAIKENLSAIMTIALLLALSAIVVLIYRRGTRMTATGGDAGRSGQRPGSIEDERDTLMRELGILERIGNFKESVILGYSRMLDFLHSKGIVALNPSTTHKDIHRTLIKVPDLGREAAYITSTFELARYSRRGIDTSRKASFFLSIRRMVERIGGGR
ncbi:MAG: hypothetical protein JW825_01510 [Candidatus Methanofastidiosa archaeon]|nr:hypothetical protein [Candidatus Methanofastidiosa archaeon]